MTEEQKMTIQSLRNAGNGYKKIAEQTGISVNSVKSFCRRNGLMATDKHADGGCLNCGKPLVQTPGHRARKFCCDSCRARWWSKHRDERIHKPESYKVCAHCGKKFSAYASFAQEESRGMSESIQWAKQKTQAKGNMTNGSVPYGYKYEDGKVTIIPEQAEVVRMIFEDYAEKRLTP